MTVLITLSFFTFLEYYFKARFADQGWFFSKEKLF